MGQLSGRASVLVRGVHSTVQTKVLNKLKNIRVSQKGRSGSREKLGHFTAPSNGESVESLQILQLVLHPATGLGGASGQIGSAIVSGVNMRVSLLVQAVHQVSASSGVAIPLSQNGINGHNNGILASQSQLVTSNAGVQKQGL